MNVRLYNSLTRTVEPLKPLKSNAVTMYVCGPTVYDDPHIGHVRSAYIFDVLQRHLTARGFNVQFVRNITDVDNKIIEKARQELGSGDLQEKCQEVAAKYLKSYHDTLKRLGLMELKEEQEPRATEHIDTMTDLIAKLLIDGIAYEAEGNVYFSVRKFAEYGRLSNRSLDDLKVGARVEPEPGKRDPMDFALWKAAKPDEPSWKSPWGQGRPGWHIECTAMSTKCLGDEFDIHGGGIDLIFPHHENEIAQAKAAGKPFARCWIHNGLLSVNGEKMSKSLGNYVTLDQVLQEYPHPDYLKLFFLKAHYRSPADYTTERMAEAKANWEEFSRFFQHYYQVTDGVSPSGGTDTDRVEVFQQKKRFEEAMDDDLNTSQALAVLFDLVNLGHRTLESDASTKQFMARLVHDVLVECGYILGLFAAGLSEEDPVTVAAIQRKVALRDTARKKKDFDAADAIRTELGTEGILLTDTSHGTLWRRRR